MNYSNCSTCSTCSQSSLKQTLLTEFYRRSRKTHSGDIHSHRNEKSRRLPLKAKNDVIMISSDSDADFDKKPIEKLRKKRRSSSLKRVKKIKTCAEISPEPQIDCVKKEQNPTTEKEFPRIIINSPPVEEKLEIHEVSLETIELKDDEEDRFFYGTSRFKTILERTLKSKHRRNLLFKNELRIVESFISLDIYAQYFLMKLLVRLPLWYDVTKLAKMINLGQRIPQPQIQNIINVLKSKNFVETDVRTLNTDTLLNMLNVENLKEICKHKTQSLKSKKKNSMIEYLKKFYKTQKTLCTTNSEDLLRNEIVKFMTNYCFLKLDVREIFFKAFLLEVFASYISFDIPKFVYKTHSTPVIEYENEFTPFKSKDSYHCYFKAKLLKHEFYEALNKKDFNNAEKFANAAFHELRTIPEEGKIREDLPEFLRRYSGEHQLISILNKASRTLLTKQAGKIREWLEFLLEEYNTFPSRGLWYIQLVHVLIKPIKKYEKAARIAIIALTEHKNDFNLIQIHEMNELARRLTNTKSFKVGCKSELTPLLVIEPPKMNSNKIKKMRGTTYRNDLSKGQRRKYSFVDESGEVNYGTVEMLALNYYEKQENFKGIHCEGRLLSLLYLLIFWEIIYDKNAVENVFLSYGQDIPIDFHTEYFYSNRKIQIDARLHEIETNQPEILKIIEQNWGKSIQFETFTQNFMSEQYDTFVEIYKCIDGKVLSKILRRLISNYVLFHSGLPDLFLWNPETQQCKFVEVKGENDQLSLKQTLWLQYMIQEGADVEVRHVTGIGCKNQKL